MTPDKSRPRKLFLSLTNILLLKTSSASNKREVFLVLNIVRLFGHDPSQPLANKLIIASAHAAFEGLILHQKARNKI